MTDLRAWPAARTRMTGDWIGHGLVFGIAWLVTFAKAVVNGDDINHMQGNYGNQAYLPNFEHGWIPNRVMDLYGRNLLAHGFDLLFFPAHAALGIGFFVLFKLFNATLFALLLCLVYRYLLAQAERMAGPVDAAGRVLLGFLVLLALPWTNEVQAICYQLPAFVTFVVLAERGKEAAPAPWLLTLGFVAAFSLEAYTAMLLAALALRWGMAGRGWRQAARPLDICICGFCLVALFAMARFSDRAAMSSHFAPMRQILGFCLHGGPAPWVALAQAGAVAAGLLGALLLCRMRGLPEAASLLGVVLCATLAVAGLISLQTGWNYFSLTLYPWGGLLLPAAFAGILAVLVLCARLQQRGAWANAIRLLVIFLLVSRISVAVTGQARSGAAESAAVLQAYRAAGAGAGPVIDTGLGLARIAMQERPLPTADSPAWFIAGYQAFFLKYYGFKSSALFR